MSDLTPREEVLTKMLCAIDEFIKASQVHSSSMAYNAILTFGDYLDQYLRLQTESKTP